ncbi:hypothetical protein BC830DRAFT_1237384 [Chytriomyces sp. MP71]|nr:hypothetical protein BC830DRAFT_1237384 [Chytriomyces sp. MP71]
MLEGTLAADDASHHRPSSPSDRPANAQEGSEQAQNACHPDKVDKVDVEEPSPNSRNSPTKASISLLQNPNKAGTQAGNRSKEEIERIVEETSKNSPFYLKQQEKNAKLQLDVQALMQREAQVTPEQLAHSTSEVRKLCKALEETRDLSRVIVHVDQDAFYAVESSSKDAFLVPQLAPTCTTQSVEELERPDLKDKPMGVGGTGAGGTLTTANYVARKWGVRSAMATYIARKLCPELIILPPRFDKYTHYSNLIRKVFEKYHPRFTPASLDEAYLDLTEYLEAHPETSADEVVQRIRTEIFETTGLTASAGIACNRMIAKVCSDHNKPNGQFTIKSEPEAILAFMQNLPVRKIPGIGAVAEQHLKALGVEKCGHLAPRLPVLRLLLNPSLFEHCLHISLGIGSNNVDRSDDIQKGIGREQTNSKMSKPEIMYTELQALVNQLEVDMKEAGLAGRCVTLKLTDVKYNKSTRSKTLPTFISKADEMFEVAQDLLVKELLSKPKLHLRLIGVRITVLESSANLAKTASVFKRTAPDSDDDPSSKRLKSTELACPVCSDIVEPSMLSLHVLACLDKQEKPGPSASKATKQSPRKGHTVATSSNSRSTVLEQLQKKPNLFESYCPVCFESVDAANLNLHVAACIDFQEDGDDNGRPIVDKSFAMKLEFNGRREEVGQKGALQCPVCNLDVAPNEATSHVLACLDQKGSTSSERATSSQQDASASLSDSALTAARFLCPLCSNEFPDSIAEDHAEECYVRTNYPDMFEEWLHARSLEQPKATFVQPQLDTCPSYLRKFDDIMELPDDHIRACKSKPRTDSAATESTKLSRQAIQNSKRSTKKGGIERYFGSSNQRFTKSKPPPSDENENVDSLYASTGVKTEQCPACQKNVPIAFLESHIAWCLDRKKA